MPRFREYHLHLPDFRFDFDNSRDLRLLYAIRVVRDLVNKSALFFLPIFLYQLGRDSSLFSGLSILDAVGGFQKGMFAIAMYFFSQGLFSFLGTVPAAKLINRYGFGPPLFWSHVLRFIGFGCIFLTQFNPNFIFLAMLFEGLQTPLFWNSYHTILSQNTLKKHMGQDLGMLQVLLQLVAVIAPALGGLVAVVYNLEALFAFALIGTAMGGGFGWLMKSRAIHDQVSWREFGQWMQENQFKKLAVSYAGRYINDATLFIWPLYVFLLLGAIEKVGYLYTVSLLLAMILSFFLGKYIDGHHSKKPFLASGGLLSLVWMVRTQVLGIGGIAVVDTFEKLAANFHWLFFDAQFIKRAKGSQALSFFAYREIIIGVVSMSFWAVFAALFIVLPVGWSAVFILAAVGVLMSMTVSDKHSHEL